MHGLRHRLALLLPAVLIATLMQVVAPPAPAWAAGPSVPLPSTPTTPVGQQTMAERPPDQASTNALSGNQPASTAPDGGGTNTATPLAASASWQVSPQTGDFSWSYPLRVPPAPGGLVPQLALGYTSSTVDGRTSATNNQASWVGDGWDLSSGFIERAYGRCDEDDAGGTKPPDNGDLCWRSDNAMASFSAGGGALIRDDTSGNWRFRSDDGARVERLTGGGNGDNDGEYWKITTVDGTQYFFGSRPEASSTWTVPVYGDDDKEPCHQAKFEASHCVQAWRWNLDKVVDRHGDTMVYGYKKESNSYGMNFKDAAVSYTRGGTLDSIEYGLRDGQPASGRVEFAIADRCVPGSDCTPDKKDNWPDVAWQDKCDTATCKDHYSPTFWSTKRLSKVTTFVRRDGDFTPVDSWTLDQQFPNPGDGEKAALWLKGITHTGHVGGETSLPAVTFEGAKKPNRVVKVDGIGPLIRYRLTGIVSESGGVTSVDYADPDCTEASMPANPESNTKRCYPARWSRPKHAERTDYFQKYVVEQVTQSDRISSNTEQVTSYEYLDGAAWHYDTSEFTKPDKRTWNEFHGFGRVRVRTGKPGDPSGPVGLTEQRFYRGMDGDKQPTGTRSVKIPDSEGGSETDSQWLQGVQRESITYDGDSVVSKVINEPTVQGPTATRGEYKAYIVRNGATQTYTTLAGGGRRITRSESGYDDRGLLVKGNDLGDTAVDGDEQCTKVTFVRNTDRWLLNLPARAETVAAKCSDTPTFPADAISDTRTAYDGQAFGTAPTTGDVTRIENLDERPASGPVYSLTATKKYDAHGRVTETADALGRVAKVAYVPAIGGPETGTVATNQVGQSVTSTIEPAWGKAKLIVDANKRRTETTFDPLGRTSQVWLPDRRRADNDTPTSKFEYKIRNDGSTVVSSTRIGANGNYTTTNELYDGLLRLRQTQVPASGGGRLLTDVRFDSQGRTYKHTSAYFNDADVDDKLWVASDVEVPGLTFTQFDGAGRPTAEIFKAGGNERWRTSTTYGGDRTTVVPPQGGTPTTSITDVRGRTVEFRQYKNAAGTGAYDTTRYAYDRPGHLKSVTDPAGDVWRFGYDLHGRKISTEDVDKGKSTMTYDAAGQLLTSTDARNTTLAYTYDDMGRKTSLRTGSITGAKLAEWTFDTATGGKGMPATSTRYVGDAAYTSTVNGYSSSYQTLGVTTTIPETEETLAGSYTSYAKFNPDGSAYSKAYPEIGDLPAETVAYSYDDLGHPVSSSGGFEGSGTIELVTDTQYTRYGELARVQFGETGKRLWQSYYYEDSTRQLNRTIVDAEVPAPMQTDTRYERDPFGNITSISDVPQGRPADTQCFKYDYLQRLTEAWTPGDGCEKAPATGSLAGPAPYWQSFTYDAAGSRRTETQHAAAGNTERTYAYPASGHRLDSVQTTGPAGTRKDTFGYDQSGNTTARPGQTLAWDAEGHVAKVTEAGKATEFVYNADGQRLIRRDPTGATLYLDGQELRLDKATGKLSGTRYYEFGGETVAMRDGKALTWLAVDHQGTAQTAVNSQTLKVTRRLQTPFGAPRGATVAFPGEKGFVGGTQDASTGLTHLGAREYDPLLGRFISVDPLLDLSDAQQMQGYSYSGNNPVTHSDPTGMWSLWGAIKSVGNTIKDAVVNTVKEAVNHPLDFAVATFVGIGIGALAAGVCVATAGIGCAVIGAVIGGAAGSMVGTSQAANRDGRAATPGELATAAGEGALSGGILHGVGAGIAKIRGGKGESPMPAKAPAPRTGQGTGSVLDGEGGLRHQAAQARDAVAAEYEHLPYEERPAAFTAAVDPTTGRWAVGDSSRDKVCCEGDALDRLVESLRSANPKLKPEQVQFTRAVGFRNGKFEEIKICKYCQQKYKPSQFPPDTGSTRGAWGPPRPVNPNTYTTSDGRLCTRGGGNCAI